MVEFRYLTVAEWGGTWSTGAPPTEVMPDGETYLHHVGGGAWMGGTVVLGLAASRAAAIRVFQALNEHAKRPVSEGGKGYQFLAYDALGWYDRTNGYGWIAEGRGRYRSAATLDRNEQGEAFCMCGNYSLRAPLPEELELAARGIVYMAAQGWTTRTSVILGHRDNPAHPGATSCPGDYLYAELPTIRSHVARLLTPEDELMLRVFQVEASPMPSPPPLFASADGLTAVWLSADQHKALGQPAWEPKPITRTEARRYTLVGDCPTGYHGIWGQDTLL